MLSLDKWIFVYANDTNTTLFYCIKALFKKQEEKKDENNANDEEDAPTLYETLHAKDDDLFGLDRIKALRSRKRNTGHHVLSSDAIGTKCGEAKVIYNNKSTHGTKNVTSQFFDTTHLTVGQDSL